MRSRLAAVRRQQVGAVVCDPVGDVEFVRGLEAGNDALDAVRTVDIEGLGPSARPTGEGHLAEFTDVVRVEVGQQDAREVAQGQPPEAQVLRRAGADVDQEHPPPGDHRRAGSGALGARQRRSAAADDDVQGAVVEQGRPVGRPGPELGLDG